MAVSGRKKSDFQATVSRGSAEDFEHSCDSCMTDGQHVDAHGFCVDCNEFLCNICLRYHQRNKASMHHQILGKNEMDKHVTSTNPAYVLTEKCSIHKDEIIKFFCPSHNEIGCHDCMTMNHRTCDLDYIPDKCSGIGDSVEYNEIMKKIAEEMKEVNSLIKTATTKDKEIDHSYDKTDKDFVKFRKQLNDHLDILLNKIVNTAKRKKLVRKQEVRTIIDSCESYTSDMKKLHSTLQQNKASGQNAQLFIDIKRVSSRLQSKEVDEAKFALAKVNTQITFNRNRNLENILTTETLGKLIEFSTASQTEPLPTKASGTASVKSSQAATSRAKENVSHKAALYDARAADATNTKTFSSFFHKNDINVKTKSNMLACNIRGIASLSPRKMVLADHSNDSVKLVDIQKQAVVEEKHLGSEPWDIAVLPQDMVAVTLPGKKQIQIITTDGKLSTDRMIEVKGKCRSVKYHQKLLHVLCWDPQNVSVLDMRGNVKKIILLADNTVFSSLNYIGLSQDNKHFYVSNYVENSVVSVKMHGELSAVYKNTDLAKPLGLLVLDDGSLLVCCEGNNTIHHVQRDLKHGMTVVDSMSSPKCICYSADRSQIYVGGYTDQVKVFDVLKYNND